MFLWKKKKARLSARKEITLDLLANHSNDQGLLHEVVGFHHLLNLRFLYGFNAEGFDRYGRDAEGYSKNGYDREGFNREGFDRQGYGRDFYSKSGFDRAGKNAGNYADYIGKLYLRLQDAQRQMENGIFRYAINDARLVMEETLRLVVEHACGIDSIGDGLLENLKICENKGLRSIPC